MKISVWRITGLAFLGLTALGLQAGCRAQKGPDEELARRIQNVENALVEFNPGAPPADPASQKAWSIQERMAALMIPGVSIAAIDGSKIDWAKSYGIVKAESPAPVKTDSLFEAASTTKFIVAAIALRFVEEGRLDLDTDVNSYLKSWQVPENEFTKDEKVTLRLLLTHQSGFPMTNMNYDDSDGTPTIVQVLKGELPAQNKPAVPEFVPGSKWQYSNVGYVAVQLLLEDVASQPLAQIAREVVFEPLGMTSSTFVYPLSKDLQAKEAIPHDAEGKAGEPAMHPTALAQGGLMTTPSDLARFTIELMQAYQGRSAKILSQEMAKQMFQPAVAMDPQILGPGLSDGLGVFIRGSGPGFAFLHPGDNYPGSSCWLVGVPDTGQGAVIMTNGAKGNLLAMEIMAALAKEYGWPEG
ncbi:MAG: beta-lactamase family protein [Candidatus Aminicenantes bacterium]|nr:beta-lactamase family protein [Candidatus Aminicenantes bacterium]